MIFFDDKLNDFNKKILEMTSAATLNIVVCDYKLDVISCTKTATDIFSVNTEDNLREFLDPSVCDGALLVFESKTQNSFLDSIDNVYYNIKLSSFNDSIILIFEREVDVSDVSSLALLSSYKFSEFINSNSLFIDKIKNKLIEDTPEYSLFLENRFNSYRLTNYNSQLIQLYCNPNTNFYPFECGNLTKVVQDIISEIKTNIKCCDITYSYDPSNLVICDFCKNQIQIVLLNLITNVFQHCSINTPIIVSVFERRVDECRETIFITVNDKGQGIDKKAFDYNSKSHYNCAYKDISSIKLGLSIVKKIIDEHYGTILFKSTENGTNFTISFPKKLSDIDELKSDTIYQTDTNITRIIKSMAGFENFTL